MSSQVSRRSSVCLPIALAASFLTLPSASASAETIKAKDAYYGTTIRKENCDETRSFVWVTAYARLRDWNVKDAAMKWLEPLGALSSNVSPSHLLKRRVEPCVALHDASDVVIQVG